VSISAVDAFDWLNSGQVEYVDVFIRTDGSQADLVAAVEPLVPDGFVVDSGDDFIQDKVDEASGFGRVLKTGLQIFAALALFVGAFVIFNTFTVIVAQRLRELAVLAAIGATPKQIKRSLRYEGLAIGIIGSAIGVIVGLGLAFAMISALELAGVALPGSGIKVKPTAVIQGLVAGTLITLFSVMRPARKAAKTEPIEALRQSAVESETLTRKRIVRTIVLVAVGVIGLLIAPNGALLGIAAVVFFVGMIIAGPLIALLGS
jgi:putative ABC transport system permease protein